MQQLAPAARTGDVAFLFSDIEGSTARWTMYPEAMPVYLHRHDELLREVILRNDGEVFKTIGDAFCAAFSTVEDAVQAAVQTQHALAKQDWSAIGGLRVRMAVHCGAVSQRDGDYFGSTVNRVSRLLSAGHGGQILLSEDAVRVVSASLPSALSLRDLGRHRLKDFPELQSIFQVLEPSLPELFPPLRTIAERPTNLPQHRPELIGREREIADLTALIAGERLVTLIGAGGVGKSSLAIEVGAQLLDDNEDGVWLLELAPADANSVHNVMAAAFGITSLTDGGTILDSLVAYLKNKQILLIVDNCEHVIASAGTAIDAIVRQCAGVRILATSRERLALAGEAPYRLGVLALPPEDASNASDVISFGACALFEQRARSHSPAFRITDQNAKLVARICRRLDGIALAIELAAPRLRALSLAQLDERLAARFRLLTGGARNAMAHHQTLQAMIDWSYGLLTENERMVLRRSALFPGGCTLGAVVEVCADESLEEWDILDHVTSLVDKSLVVLDEGGEEQRYRQLESTREYALQRLDESGERDAIAGRQAQYFLNLAQRSDAAWPAIPAPLWLTPLAAEVDNFRAVLTWCVQRDQSTAIRMFGALDAFWWDAYPIEGRRWVEALREYALANPGTSETARYWLAAGGIALTLAKEKVALHDSAKAVEAYRALGDAGGEAAALRCRGTALIRRNSIDEGEACIEQALKVFREKQYLRLAALALRSLAAAPVLRGDMDRAAKLYREALAISQPLKDERGIQIISGNLAEIEAHAGNYESALEHAREALEIARHRRDWVVVCTLLINTAAYLFALGRLSEVRSTAREALDIAAEIQSDIHLTVAIQHLASISAHDGDAARGARLLAYTDAAYARLEAQREPTEAREYEQAMAALRRRMSETDYEESIQAGAVFTCEQAKVEAFLT